MTFPELRDPDEARRFLLQGLWLQRSVPSAATSVRPALEWALEIASAGNPLPPVGFVADVGLVAFGQDREGRPREALPVAGLSSGLARTYEDHVLGKLYADATFERAADALRRYEGRDRARGLAFIVDQFRQRAGFGGALLSPAVIKGLLEGSPDDALSRGWDSLTRDGLMPLLAEMVNDLIAAVRRTAEVLGPEDLSELEHGTFVAELGQRVAHRLVVQTARRLEDALPRHKVRPLAGRQEVPTRVLDEDTYPVGGFSSLSTRGSVESLLHSQLAFMEGAGADRPDLFDVKFIRDELLYYSRDENQFLRRRRSFVFALLPDLTRARFKDVELPCQRIVLVLALLLTGIRKLTEWLTADALKFEFLFVGNGDPPALAQEEALLQMLLREPIANGTVRLSRAADLTAAGRFCTEQARRSLCQALTVSAGEAELWADDTLTAGLRVDGPQPVLTLEDEAPDEPETDEAFDAWVRATERLLRWWV
jgi:hypothetical protein